MRIKEVPQAILEYTQRFQDVSPVEPNGDSQQLFHLANQTEKVKRIVGYTLLFDPAYTQGVGRVSLLPEISHIDEAARDKILALAEMGVDVLGSLRVSNPDERGLALLEDERVNKLLGQESHDQRRVLQSIWEIRQRPLYLQDLVGINETKGVLELYEETGEGAENVLPYLVAAIEHPAYGSDPSRSMLDKLQGILSLEELPEFFTNSAYFSLLDLLADNRLVL